LRVNRYGIGLCHAAQFDIKWAQGNCQCLAMFSTEGKQAIIRSLRAKADRDELNAERFDLAAHKAETLINFVRKVDGIKNQEAREREKRMLDRNFSALDLQLPPKISKSKNNI